MFVYWLYIVYTEIASNIVNDGQYGSMLKLGCVSFHYVAQISSMLSQKFFFFFLLLILKWFEMLYQQMNSAAFCWLQLHFTQQAPLLVFQAGQIHYKNCFFNEMILSYCSRRNCSSSSYDSMILILVCQRWTYFHLTHDILSWIYHNIILTCLVDVSLIGTFLLVLCICLLWLTSLLSLLF